MPKRGAERQITKDDDLEASTSSEQADGTWKAASAEKIAARKIVKVRRKEKTGGAAAAPAGGFNLVGDSKPAAAGGFNFDFTAGAEKPAAAPVNAFAALVNKDNWECKSCLVSNKKDATVCAACEVPKQGEKKEEAKKPAAAPAGGVNAFAALVNKDNWECKSCLVSNKKEAKVCAACEVPREGEKAGGEEKKVDGGAAIFGSSFNAKATASGFSFGGTPAGGFNFKSSDSASSGFTFGGDSSKLTFGGVSATKSTSFGGGDNAAAFSAATEFKAKEAETKEEFKGKKAEASGTEKDKTIFKIATKAYHLKAPPSKEGEPKPQPKFSEIGSGEVHVNTIEDGSRKARLVLRADKTQRLVLNAPLYSGMSLQLQGDKFVKFVSKDLENKTAVYLLKVKNKTESTMLHDKMNAAIKFLDKK